MSRKLEEILEQMDVEELNQMIDFEVDCKEDEAMERVKQSTMKKIKEDEGKKKWLGFRKGMAVAASVAFIISAGAFVYSTGFGHGTSGIESTTGGSSAGIMHNDMEYHVLLDEKELKENNLPSKITDSMIGECVDTIKDDNGESKLYQYKEAEDEHYLIMKDYNGDYVFIVNQK